VAGRYRGGFPPPRCPTPSFDTVSEVDHHEIANAVDQADRAVSTRFDFKTADSSFELDGNRIRLSTQSEFQLNRVVDRRAAATRAFIKPVVRDGDLRLRDILILTPDRLLQEAEQ